MSGGVDSLRAAIALREQGHEIFGIHMRLFPCNGDLTRVAGIVAAREEILRELAVRCDIPLKFIDLRNEFRSLVISPFIDNYLRGLTPNPCVVCNPAIKFGLLLQEALKCGAQRLATGHYAQLIPPGESVPSRFQVRRAKDTTKDQSYFLMGLSQEQLSLSLFPLGVQLKQQTVAWAERLGLKALITGDSQEICFIISEKYTEFLARHAGGKLLPGGPIIDMAGNRIGTHKGIHFYTVGQRRGLGLPSTEPYYVVRIEPEINAVRVGRRDNLFRGQFMATRLNWVSIDAPFSPFWCDVRIRNLHRPARAEVTPLPGNTVSVRFIEPQRAVTPGQAAVFYSEDLLLGGGIISPPA